MPLNYYNNKMGNLAQSQSFSKLHPTLGCWMLRGGHQQEPAQMLITRLVDSQSEYDQWKEHLSKLESPLAREVLFLPSSSAYQESNCCGLAGVVQLNFQGVFPFTLQSELQFRREKCNPYLETELWYLLYTLVRACSIFEAQHMKVGDVHPSNILVSEEGAVKLITTSSFPRQTTNFDKKLQNAAEKVFLAPEQLAGESIKTGMYPEGIDQSLAECYSVGLCLLAAATLEEVELVYIEKDGGVSIQTGLVEHYLQKLSSRYSSFFYSIMEGLLAPSPLLWKKCTNIYSAIHIYGHKISALEPFYSRNIKDQAHQQQHIPTNQYSYCQAPSLSALSAKELYKPIYSKSNCINTYYFPKVTPSSPKQCISTHHHPNSSRKQLNSHKKWQNGRLRKASKFF